MELIYLAGKLGAYTLWAFVGFEHFQASAPRPSWKPFLVAALRVVAGLLFALPMWLLGSTMLEAASVSESREVAAYLIYLFLYGAFRWAAWSAVAPLVFREARGLKAIFVGAHTKDRLWRFGGVLVSFAVDVPVILSVGGPMVGKFFC